MTSWIVIMMLIIISIITTIITAIIIGIITAIITTIMTVIIIPKTVIKSYHSQKAQKKAPRNGCFFCVTRRQKMSEGLRAVADCLLELSEAIKELSAELTPEPEIKVEEVRKVLAEMSKRGKTGEVKALLQKYGAEKLSDVKPKDYADMLKEAVNA